MTFAQERNDVLDIYDKGTAAYNEENYEEALTLLKDAYAKASALEDGEDIVNACKPLIPKAAYRIADKLWDSQPDWQLVIAKFEEALAVATEFEDAEYVEKATDNIKNARYEAAKALEDTDEAAAIEALKALVETDERAAGRIAKIYRNQATEIKNGIPNITDAAEKQAAYQTVYELAKQSLEYENDPKAVKMMGDSCYNTKKYDEAIDLYNAYFETQPEGKGVWSTMYNLARSYETVKNKTKALELYKKIVAEGDDKSKGKAQKRIDTLNKK